MKNLILGLVIFTSTSAAMAANPYWLKSATRTEALNFLIEMMQDEAFYKITNIQTTETKLPSGQDAVEVIIKFNDSLGCDDRVVISECSALDDTAMACRSQGSYCEPAN